MQQKKQSNEADEVNQALEELATMVGMYDAHLKKQGIKRRLRYSLVAMFQMQTLAELESNISYNDSAV